MSLNEHDKPGDEDLIEHLLDPITERAKITKKIEKLKNQANGGL